MPLPLHGTIVHRFRLPSERKKSQAKATNRTDTAGQNHDVHNNSNDNNNTCGFFLVPCDQTSSSPYTERLLSLPHRLQKVACHASRSGSEVILRRYAEIPISTHTGGGSSYPMTEMMIEAHELELLPTRYQQTETPSSGYSASSRTTTNNNKPNNIAWTLSQFWRKERVETVKPNARFDIRVTVDAISPIVGMDPSHPFVLIEAYDSEQPSATCVIVMYGASSAMHHAAIIPSQTLVFRGVVYKPWSVPTLLRSEEYRHLLQDRIPSRVFVVTEPDCLVWDVSEQPSRHNIPPTIITPVNLVTRLQGRIDNVDTFSKRTTGHGKETILRYIDMVLTDTDGSEMSSTTAYRRLYLSFLPMSMALQNSLRNGAIVQAHNIHAIASHSTTNNTSEISGSYGACLRSSLVLLKHASDTTIDLTDETQRLVTQPHSDETRHNTSRRRPRKEYNDTAPTYPFRNHCYRKIDHNYLQDIYHEMVEDWTRNNFGRNPEVVPKQWLGSTLLNHGDWDNNSTIRDDSTHNADAPKRKPSPYAGFFDHPFHFPREGNKEAQPVSCGCHLTLQDRTYDPSRAVALRDLNSIRLASQAYFESHISKLLASPSERNHPFHRFRQGFHASLRVAANELFSNNSNCQDFVCGFVSEFHTHQKRGVASIADGCCQIPIYFDKEPFVGKGNDFVLGRLDSVTISCLCLSNLGNNGDSFSSDSKSLSFPSLDSRKNNLLGNCSMVTVRGLLFVTALQLHCCESRLLETGDSSLAEEEQEQPETIIVSIADCLATPLSEPSDTVVGMLTRCRFRAKLRADGSHEVCRLWISDNDDSHLQGLEMKLSVASSTARMIQFQELLNQIWLGGNLMEAQKQSGSSFWVLGGSGKTFALTIGGSEDIVPGSFCSKSTVQVFFPSSSLQLTPSGYIGSFCTHDAVGAVFVDGEACVTSSTKADGSRLAFFDFVGGLNSKADTLTRRPPRRSIVRPTDPFRFPIGELSSEPGIPHNTLSDLFGMISESAKDPARSQNTMNPSLVRKISHSRYLGVSFCRAQAYCNRCFCSLEPPNATLKRKTMHDSEPDFTKLRCPKKNCASSTFGINWECSGILDDGTGQATLYADGGAALTLLGMSMETIRSIEEGIWWGDDGSLQFLRSIPPSMGLRNALTRVIALQQFNTTTINDPLRLLSVQDRAAYLFEKHCRISSKHCRPLDYYVRCKPTKKNGGGVPHVHHTKINSFFQDSSIIHRCQVASYTLPPLKLELVDCGVVTSSSSTLYPE